MLGKLPPPQALEIVRPGDLIPDNRLPSDAPDLLEHDAIARGVAEIAWSADAPVNIALFGPWGSGKSSVYSMIDKHLARIAPKKVRIARYDAWKYGGRELKRNFINSLAHELDLEDKPEFSNGLESDQVDTKMDTLGWVRKNWLSLLVGIGLAAALAALWVLVQAGIAWAFTDGNFKVTSKLLLPQAGTVFGLALVASLVGPKAFEGAVITNTTAAPEGSDQFAKRFKDLVKSALRGKHERLVVFIDELDRCDPKDVVATLIDLKTFLDEENCAFIVAADREVIERALRQVPQAKPVREDEPYYATPGAFLDKIFQHQLALPPLRSRALTKFAHDLVDDQGGIWEELRADGKDTFDRTVFALVPVHVRSPRRVKVLLNNFATNARIAHSRGLDWLDRAHEVAVLTVLQTEFPNVADELHRAPRLLVYLRGDETPTGELSDVVARYRASATTEPTKAATIGAVDEDDPANTAAGRLLSDDGTTTGARDLEVAGETLRRHLANYLAKVAAAGIRDPRPDLLYLQAAGGREALADPKLGDAIDFATDTAPDSVVAAFDDESSSTLTVAIPLLVTEADNETGPGQKFAFEAACRLIERLDPEDRAAVAQQVAPSLIAAVTSGTLSDLSLPGALLVSSWSGAHDVVHETLGSAARRGPSEKLLAALTVLLPHLDDDGRLLLVAMLADSFGEHQQPLLRALRDAPVDSAVELWSSVSDRVLEVLNHLELTEDNEDNGAATTSARASQAAVAADPKPTGDGVSLLAELVDVVRSRTDHEPLLSAVIATAQSEAANDQLRGWVVENIDSLVGTMSSPTRRARHALLGMKRCSGQHRDSWAAVLPNPADVGDGDAGPALDDSTQWDSDVADVAEQLLHDLVGAFATAADSRLRTLPNLTVTVAGWGAASDESIAASVASALQDIGWDDASADDTAGQLLWDRKEALLAMSAKLATGDDSPLFHAFVTDLGDMLHEISLTPFATSGWRNLAGQLPKGAAEALSETVDEYEPSEAEKPAVLGLRLAIRSAFGGPAPAASAFTDLALDQRTTALTDAWLSLEPSSEDACAVLPAAQFTSAAMLRYSTALNTEERTALWLALRRSDASDGALRVAGSGGLGVEAVEKVAEDIGVATREPDRSALAGQLTAAKAAADVDGNVRKAVSALASDLIGKNTVGDFRTAAELVLWAGGAGHGHTQTLRQKLNAAPEGHRKALPQSVTQRLVDLRLLNAPPPKKKRRLFGA
ncbi:P-loop NTPase fold protein [Aeromicrobium sp.]|uniref:P-loop NTPase fold protein n=1 Tax=Aeromicrobium sp. TaxID=1871063 RepID=UPI0028A937B0|nr:P-loop NTPase fold protein [Aeromicrobium sp.]